MAIFFLLLITTHLIGDFCMQFDWVLRLKHKHVVGIALHVAIHLLVLAVLLDHPQDYLPLFILLGGSHFLIDWIKLHGSEDNKRRDFWLDQLAHFSVIVLLVLFLPAATPAIAVGFLKWLAAVAVFATALALVAIFKPSVFMPFTLPYKKLFLLGQGLGSSALVTLRIASLML